MYLRLKLLKNNLNDLKEHLLAVYGTLKENFPNYFYYLNPNKPIFRGAVKIPFKMYSEGGFPLLFPSETDNSIYLEVFQVSEKLLLKIDRLEGVPHLYSREKIFLNEINSDVFIYVITNREPYGEEIKDGIFRKVD